MASATAVLNRSPEDELTLHRFRVGAQAQHFAVGYEVADGEHFVRVFGELRGEPPDAARDRLAPGSVLRAVVEELAPAPRSSSARRSCWSSSGSCSSSSATCWKLRCTRTIVGGELGSFLGGHLLREPLDRADAVDQRAAGARRLRRAEHRAAALLGQALGIPGE
jgi:hypothetical protein